MIGANSSGIISSNHKHEPICQLETQLNVCSAMPTTGEKGKLSQIALKTIKERDGETKELNDRELA